MRVLLLLSLWQLKNALLRTFRDRRRLALLVLAVAAFIGFRHTGDWSAVLADYDSPDTGRAIMPLVPALRAGAFLLLALIACAKIDQACVSAVLEFSAADVDYLFPSPCPRRLLLAAKLPALGLVVASATAFLAFAFGVIWLPLAALRPGHAAHGATAAVLSLALCLGAYFNLAVGVELFCRGRAGRAIRRGLIAVTALAALAVGVALHAHGPAGLALVAQNSLMAGLFLPCRWCADAAFDPLLGRSNTPEALRLAALYAVTLALLFLRDANYYEAALVVSEQARDRRAALAAGGGLALPQPGRRERLYTLPPFGRGAGALLWANLAASLKRPVLFFLPLAGGALVAWAAMLVPADDRDLILGVINGYVVFIPALIGQVGFQGSLGRQPLVRALPIPEWQAVLAESVPRLLPAALWGLGECGLLLARHHPRPLVYAPLLLVALPLETFCLGLLSYAVVLAYPGAQDKFQALLSTFLNMLLLLVVISVQALFAVLPALSGVSRPLIPWVFILGCLATGALVFSFTVRLYRAYQPAEDIPHARRPARPRRLPEPDEALALALVFPWLALYGGLWVHFQHPDWARTDLFLNLLIGEGGLIALPPLLFAVLGRYRWTEVFSWRRTTTREMAGAALLGLGALPWVFALNVSLQHFWPSDPARAETLLGQFLPALAAHPVLAPLAIGLAAGVTEEILYRGPILAGLRRRLPLWPALLVSGFLFAAIHLDAHGLLFRTLLGVLLGWVVVRGGSLFPAMLMHGIIDAAVFGDYAWLVHRDGVAGFVALARHPPPVPPPVWALALGIGAALFGAGLALCRRAWRVRDGASSGILSPNT